MNSSPRKPSILHRAPDELNRKDPFLNSTPTTPSKQPNIPKQNHHGREEPNPHSPPDPRPLRHPKHPIHRPAQPHPRVVERIVHPIRQGRRVADLVADRHGDLYVQGHQPTTLSLPCARSFFSFLYFTFLSARSGQKWRGTPNVRLSASSPWRSCPRPPRRSGSRGRTGRHRCIGPCKSQTTLPSAVSLRS